MTTLAIGAGASAPEAGATGDVASRWAGADAGRAEGADAADASGAADASRGVGWRAQVSRAAPISSQSEITWSSSTTPSAPSPNLVRVLSGQRRQTMLGIGGAMTEASASVLSRLSPAQRQEVYNAYFSRDGARYSVLRSSVGSCDFSLSDYSYADKEDTTLESFSIAKDRELLIPAIKAAKAINPDLKLFAAPWAPPAWMMQAPGRAGGESVTRYARGGRALKDEHYGLYAEYLTRYVEAYRAEGLPVYALSTQNEAQNIPPWECCWWSTGNMAAFISQHLGPRIRSRAPETRLVIWDWDKGNDALHHDGFLGFNRAVLSDPQARAYIDGIAFHWYAGDLWHLISGSPMWSEDFASLREIKAEFPDIHLYGTEGGQENGPWLRSWTPAERYAYDIINDIENGTETWIDWNMVLDSAGGPHHVNNNCHAPVAVDFSVPGTPVVMYNPSYHVLREVSRVVQPGTRSIATSGTAYLTTPNVDVTGIAGAVGTASLLFANRNDHDVPVTVRDGDREAAITLQARSFSTFTYAGSTVETFVDLATCTAYANGHQGGHVPANVLTEGRNTRWASDWTDRQWLDVVFPQPRTVSGAMISFENNGSSEFLLETSVDGRTWTTAFRAAKGGYASKGVADIRFTPTTATRLRFHGVSRSEPYGYSIFAMRPIAVL